MKDQQDKIVAVDFGASCFLPVSFFAFVLGNSLNPFTQSIAQLITYPKPTLEQTNALLAAHQALVPHMSNDPGEHISLPFIPFPASRPPCKETDFSVRHKSPRRAQGTAPVDLAADILEMARCLHPKVFGLNQRIGPCLVAVISSIA